MDQKENVRYVHLWFLLCYSWSANCIRPMAWCVQRHRPDPCRLSHFSGREDDKLAVLQIQKTTQIQSQPSVCGCAEVTSVRIQFKSPMTTVTLNQPSSLPSSAMSFRNPEKQNHPDFILRRTFFSFFLSFLFFFWIGLTGVKGDKGNPGIGTQGPRGPPGPAGNSSYLTGNCKVEILNLYIHLTLQVRQMAILHPCVQLEWLYFSFLSLEGQFVSNEPPNTQAPKDTAYSGILLVAWVRLG